VPTQIKHFKLSIRDTTVSINDCNPGIPNLMIQAIFVNWQHPDHSILGLQKHSFNNIFQL